MRMSENGISLLKRFEGLELEAYQDIAGVWTIGYGHTGPDVKPGMRISEREAEDLLRRDLRSREQAVDRLTSVPINQNEFDALVSFVYNVGIEAYRGSTARRRLNKGDRIGAAEALTWWNKATIGGVLRPVVGLTRRRASERGLFLTPTNPPIVNNPKEISENSRVTPIEDSPRRGNLGESRSIQGATVAGGAGVAASTMGKNDAEELDEMETRIEEGDDLVLDGEASDEDTSSDTDDASTDTSDSVEGTTDENTETSDGDSTSDEEGNTTEDSVAIDDNLTEIIEVGSDRPSKHEKHAADAQVQFALLIMIVLAVAFVIFSRVDDWFNYRR